MRASARIPAGDFGHSHLGENENQTQPLFLSSSPFFLWDRLLARISHHLTAEARDKPAITSLRLLTVLTVLFKYASAR